MAEFLITKTDRHGRTGKIQQVEVRQIVVNDAGRKAVDSPQIKSTGWVVDRMVEGHKFQTATWSAQQQVWNIGQDVDFFIRSKADDRWTNNLDALPTF